MEGVDVARWLDHKLCEEPGDHSCVLSNDEQKDPCIRFEMQRKTTNISIRVANPPDLPHRNPSYERYGSVFLTLQQFLWINI
jgi:hypothetical protein